MILLRRYKVRRSGRGHVIALPETWMETLKITQGSIVKMYQDGENLIIMLDKKDEQSLAQGDIK